MAQRVLRRRSMWIGQEDPPSTYPHRTIRQISLHLNLNVFLFAGIVNENYEIQIIKLKTYLFVRFGFYIFFSISVCFQAFEVFFWFFFWHFSKFLIPHQIYNYLTHQKPSQGLWEYLKYYLKFQMVPNPNWDDDAHFSSFYHGTITSGLG